MESSNLFDISLEQWVEEVNGLSQRSAGKFLFVKVQWQFGHLHAIAFQPQVHDTMIEIPLQPQSPSGSCDGYLQLFLPTDNDLIECERHLNLSGESVLTIRWNEPPYGWTNLQIATNLDFLNLVNSETAVQ